MDEDRKKTISEAEMPKSVKSMQRFLGAALFFSEFIPNYSESTRLLYDMTRNTFNWDPSTWGADYRSAFERVKECLVQSVEKFFPDYDLNWILRVDASDTAVGAVLLQIKIIDGKEVYQPIGFKSQKFSGAALNWDTHKKEAYALYFGTKSFAYYLRGKPFIIETDHANLQYIEKSEVPIIIRWRVYLQSFSHVLRHIKGKHNVVADWASRLYRIISSQIAEDVLEGETELHALREELAVYMLSLSDTEVASVPLELENSGALGSQFVDMAGVFREFIGCLDDEVEPSPVFLCEQVSPGCI